VTFTRVGGDPTIQIVVWQFWGRAAEASWTEKSRALFCLPPDTDPLCRLPVQSLFSPALWQKLDKFLDIPARYF